MKSLREAVAILAGATALSIASPALAGHETRPDLNQFDPHEQPVPQVSPKFRKIYLGFIKQGTTSGMPNAIASHNNQSIWLTASSLARSYLMLGDTNGALALVDQGIESIGPGSIVDDSATYRMLLFDFRGRVHQLRGDATSALRDYSMAYDLALQPDNAHTYMAREVASLQRSLVAMLAASAAQELAGERAKAPTAAAQYDAAMAGIAKSDLAGARTALDQAIAIDPTFAPFWLARARVHGQLKDGAAALSDARTARKLASAPVLVEYLDELGLALIRLGQFDQASPFLDAAANDAPWAEMPRLARKALALQRVRQTNPHAAAMADAAYRKAQGGDAAGAFAAMDQAAKAEPGLAIYRYERANYANMLAKAGATLPAGYGGIEADLAEAARLDPLDLDVAMARGFYYAARGQQAEAWNWLNQAYKHTASYDTSAEPVVLAMQDSYDTAQAAIDQQHWDVINAETAQRVKEVEERKRAAYCNLVFSHCED